MARALVGGDQIGQGVRRQEGDVAVGDDDGAGDGLDGLIEGLEAALDGAAGAGNLVLVGDDGAGQHALNLGGDDVALVTHDGDQVLGVEAVGGAQGVSDHGQARQGVNDLRESRFHARSLACGQDDDGGGARHVPPRGSAVPSGPVAPPLGFEPRLKAPKTSVLPLHQGGMRPL